MRTRKKKQQPRHIWRPDDRVTLVRYTLTDKGRAALQAACPYCGSVNCYTPLEECRATAESEMGQRLWWAGR